MTQEELNLAKIAKKIQKANVDINPKLVGSLMLSMIGAKLRRQATDIDFVVDELSSDVVKAIKMPRGATLISPTMDSDSSSICFTIKNKDSFGGSHDIKVEFMESANEKHEDYKFNSKETNYTHLQLGSIKNTLEYKLYYAAHDDRKESKEKHILDIEYMLLMNKSTLFECVDNAKMQFFVDFQMPNINDITVSGMINSMAFKLEYNTLLTSIIKKREDIREQILASGLRPKNDAFESIHISMHSADTFRSMYLDVLNKISKLPSAQRTVVKSLGDMSFRNALLKYKSIADKYKPEAGSVQNKTISDE